MFEDKVEGWFIHERTNFSLFSFSLFYTSLFYTTLAAPRPNSTPGFAASKSASNVASRLLAHSSRTLASIRSMNSTPCKWSYSC